MRLTLVSRQFCNRFIVLSILVANLFLPAGLTAQTVTRSLREGQWFDRTVGVENSGLINGIEYKMALVAPTSHPFVEKSEVNGVVIYKGQTYSGPLLYDIHLDEVIVKHLNASGRVWFVQLNKDWVDEFTIAGRRFVNLNGRFHEVLFEKDDLRIVARRSKFTRLNKGIFNYEVNDRYFIVDGENWRVFSGKAGISSIVSTKEDRKKVRSFISQNKIRVSRFDPQQLAKIGAFIYSLRKK